MPGLVRIVRRSIALNDQLCFMTIEVCDVIAILMLSSELEAQQLSIPEQLPKQCFGRRLFLSQFPRTFHQARELISSSILSGLTPSPLGRRLGRGCIA